MVPFGDVKRGAPPEGTVGTLRGGESASVNRPRFVPPPVRAAAAGHAQSIVLAEGEEGVGACQSSGKHSSHPAEGTD